MHMNFFRLASYETFDNSIHRENARETEERRPRHHRRVRQEQKKAETRLQSRSRQSPRWHISAQKYINISSSQPIKKLTNKPPAQKIKTRLIETAKIKKTYAKLKRQANIADEALPQPATIDSRYEGAEPTTSPHPDRQALINKPAETEEIQTERKQDPRTRHRDLKDKPRPRHPKPQPFAKAHSHAQQRQAEAEERRKAREEADRQRKLKSEEREKFRRAMAKARTGGRNGQRKLGRESSVLLERVRRRLGE